MNHDAADGRPVPVWVHCAHFYLADPDLGTDRLPGPDSASDGILALGTDGGCVLTGLHTGYVHVTVRPHTVAPAPAGTEACAEAGFLSTTGRLNVHSWEDGSIDELPNLAAAGPGRYRLRVRAQGRALGRRLDSRAPEAPVVESYLLETWTVPDR
ncbi:MULTISPECIES: hypothetical protein [unclassified Streptomyces]|uniref:hypothetical protein n=1 Tax=unclassified Streptomyces TaxID=2593676 RepID=UPI000DBA0ADD|nr:MULTISPECIES: hypothetical protein [unclassified Streptomyces]MYT74488.1 hypothetical protein [Streptomyces sp. SID8367]RAJ91467.1 hypothetical protein K377_00232 [Streptomyces sp. PsTaAH-137]